MFTAYPYSSTQIVLANSLCSAEHMSTVSFPFRSTLNLGVYDN